MLYIIAFIIIIVSLGVILFIILKRLPEIRMINVDTISEEKDSKTKKKIVAQRLERKFSTVKERGRVLAQPIIQTIQSNFKNFHKTVLDLDKKLSQENIQNNTKGDKEERGKKIDDMEVQAEKLIGEEKYQEAEEIYFAMINIDTNNLKAYKALGELYILKKEHDKAKEIFEYILKFLKSKKGAIKKKGIDYSHLTASCYEELGSLSHFEGKQREAMHYFQKALDIEPKNPKYFHIINLFSTLLFISFCIILYIFLA